MFKNVMVYRIGPEWSVSLAQLEAGLQENRFVECGLTQEKSVGWTAPRGDVHGALVEAVGGQWLLKLMLESKAVPGSVLSRKARERAAQIEAVTGRKPGKKEMKEIKEEARITLLPMAFTKQGAVLVWIDPAARLLVIDAASQAKADEVLTCLAKSMPGLGAVLVQTTISPVAAMADWLRSQEPPAGFSVDRECELKAGDDSKAVVRYSRHALDIEEVQQHIAMGKLPTRLAMTWEGRVSFVLTEALQIKKLAFVDGVFQDDASASKDDRFDADAAIATGEIRRLIPDLLEALGGEMTLGVQPLSQPLPLAA
ncbi:recombination-associated protein RdgC [Polaromonas sp.]|uniref:recombination-associated protein RdgC n=1 Tax=Polaromonas sp. TaxID=1869339 RepID=UPI00286C9C34|nr:recombination-associated protein RdgC [Polaromonas sp.]